MSTTATSPHLSRKYGKHDFERFDNLLSHHASVGAASIGKVNVDCRFLFRKSQWGVLTEAENPAGIIYLDLSFSQPSNCRLKSATVTVTLDEDDDDLQRQAPGHRTGRQSVPVQIGSYGPQQFNGRPRQALKTQRNTVMPSFNVMGLAGAGGVGRESKKYCFQESRWAFSSQLLPDSRSKKNSWAYKVLKWELTENDLEAQSIHSNVIHTAFSFEHDGQPFFMQVEVSGRLESLRSDLKNDIKSKFRKLKFPSNSKEERCATTLINFGGRHKFRKPLDELARSLPLAMEGENMESIPMQIPDSQPATFHDNTPKGEHLMVAAANAHLNRPKERRNGDVSDHQGLHLPTEIMRPLLQQAPVSLSGILREATDATNDPTLPTPENFAGAFFSLTRPRDIETPPIEGRQSREAERSGAGRGSRSRRAEEIEATPDPCYIRVETSDISSMTLVDPEHDEIDEITKAINSTGAQKQALKEVDHDAILSFLKISGLLAVVQVIMGLLSSWGVKLSPNGKSHKSKMNRPRESNEDDLSKTTLNKARDSGRVK